MWHYAERPRKGPLIFLALNPALAAPNLSPRPRFRNPDMPHATNANRRERKQ
jgi:hypothetical protein